MFGESVRQRETFKLKTNLTSFPELCTSLLQIPNLQGPETFFWVVVAEDENQIIYHY